jgi:hypothetical protein
VTAVFDRASRYRAVPDVVVPDATGRVLAAKDFRPLPDVTGGFRHTVLAGDRLDRLATTYYGEPLRYWRICDANPAFLSPLAMLDREPVVTTRFPVAPPTGTPPWAALLAALAATVGVEGVTAVEESSLVEVTREIDGQRVTVQVDRFDRAVLVTHNRVNVDQPALRDVIVAAGFTAGPPVEVGQVGQRIVVPPAGNG